MMEIGSIDSLAQLLEASDGGSPSKVALDLIDFDPFQPRQHITQETLEELASSIRQHGVIQPVEVKPADDGRFVLIWGERRVRAARIAGLTDIPAQIRQADELQTLTLQLIENMQGLRETITPLEEAIALDRLIGLVGSLKAAAEAVSKSETYVSHRIKLLNLPQFVIDLYTHDITRDVDVLVTVGKIAELDLASAQTLCEEAMERGALTREEARETLVRVKSAKKPSVKGGAQVVSRREVMKSIRMVRKSVVQVCQTELKGGDPALKEKLDRLMSLLDEILQSKE